MIISSKFICSVLACIAAVVLTTSVFAQAQPSPSQTGGGVLRQREDREKLRDLEERVTTPRETVESAEEEAIVVDENAPRTMISTITVEGATLVSQSEIDTIIAEYQGQELTLAQMRRIASDITALYRTKGYVTSRAYIPPQNLTSGMLIIRVVEGRLGEFSIEGNKYFSTKLLRKKFDLTPGEPFDYSAMQKALININESADRTARVVLRPSQQPGATDVYVQVEDQLPIHVGYEYDNYASRFLDKDRHAITLEHNNLTGHDDKFFFKFQTSESFLLELYEARYLLPLSSDWELSFYFQANETELAKDFKGFEAYGEAAVYGSFLSYRWINREDLEWRWSIGMDLKDARNYFLGNQTSKDDLTIIKLGTDIDKTDRWGRTVFTAQADFGIDNFLGSMDGSDSNASRSGAGGEFTKGVFNLFRLQPMFKESAILIKNTAQWTSDDLVSSEQYQIGGPWTVRAYAPAEKSGDKGAYSAIEWSFPFYGLSRDLMVPKKNVSWYDSLRWVVFYDYGYVAWTNAAAGEQENDELKGYGAGIRFNPSEDLSFRVEAGLPEGDNSADGRHAHFWWEFGVSF